MLFRSVSQSRYAPGTQIATLLKKAGANDVDLFGFKLSFLFHHIINLLGFPCKALNGTSGHEFAVFVFDVQFPFGRLFTK